MNQTNPVKDAGAIGANQNRFRAVKTLVVHPFLLTLYPVLALLAANYHEIPQSHSYRLFVVLLIGAAILFLFP